jgi:hypothetical protein
MIKRDESGKVVEFEDEAAVAAMNHRRVVSGGTQAAGQEPTAVTEQQVLSLYEDAIKKAEAESATSMKALTTEIGSEMAKLDSFSKLAKSHSKESLKKAIERAELLRRETVEMAEQAHQSRLERIWSQYRDAIAPLNTKLEAGKSELEKSLQTAKDAALAVHKIRLAEIAKSTKTAAKVEAVVAESLPTVAPSN